MDTPSAHRVQPSTSEDVLVLVRTALEEFDNASLSATIRRAIRIANLLGEPKVAVRMGLELKPLGGHPPSNAEMTRRLLVDPESWGRPDGPVEQAILEYTAERKRADGLITAHSIAELEFWEQRELPESELTNAQYVTNLENQRRSLEIRELARHHAFTLLCMWERQLTFAVTQQGTLEASTRRVDTLLARDAPDVLDMFNVAIRRLREAAKRSSPAEMAEELSQAATSCRRILKAVVDSVQPADPAHRESSDGHPLTDEHYKNRLFEFLKIEVESKSFRNALDKDGESLFARFDMIDSLSSKGVHAEVVLEEVEFCALHTYLLAGEVLSLAMKRSLAD